MVQTRKKKIQYDQCYTNSPSSSYLAKARTNTLQVEEFIHRRNKNHDTVCRLSGLEQEDIQHFLVTCPMLNQKRDREIIESWRSRNKHRQTVNILFKEKRYSKVSHMIKRMWDYRKDLLRPLQVARGTLHQVVQEAGTILRQTPMGS